MIFLSISLPTWRIGEQNEFAHPWSPCWKGHLICLTVSWFVQIRWYVCDLDGIFWQGQILLIAEIGYLHSILYGCQKQLWPYNCKSCYWRTYCCNYEQKSMVDSFNQQCGWARKSTTSALKKLKVELTSAGSITWKAWLLVLSLRLQSNK